MYNRGYGEAHHTTLSWIMLVILVMLVMLVMLVLYFLFLESEYATQLNINININMSNPPWGFQNIFFWSKDKSS